MIKYAIFDIDGTLRETGKNVSQESLDAIRKLEENGVKIFFASGKHPWYTTGGTVFGDILKDDTIVIGENGGYIFKPRRKEDTILAKSEDVEKIKAMFYIEIDKMKINFWEEPKRTIFTIYPLNEKENNIKKLVNFFEEKIKENNLDLYVTHCKDAVDVVPNKMNKSVALKYLQENGELKLEETIAFGDGKNDYEMLSSVKIPITFNNALNEIKELVKSKNGYVSDLSYGKGVLDAVTYLIENKKI